MSEIEKRLEILEKRLTDYEKSGFWQRRDVLKGIGAGLIGLAGIKMVSGDEVEWLPSTTKNFKVDMNTSNPNIFVDDIAVVKTTAGQTINVSTAAGFQDVLSKLAAAPSLLGNVTIQLAAGTYTGDFVIPTLVNNGYSLTIQGTFTLDTTGLTIDSYSTDANEQGLLGDTGLTANAFQNKLCKFTSGAMNGNYRVVDSNSTTQIITVASSSGSPSAGDTYEIYTWGSYITGKLTMGYHQNIILNDLKLGKEISIKFSNVTFNRIYINQSGTLDYSVYSTSYISINDSLFLNSGTTLVPEIIRGSEIYSYRNKYQGYATAGLYCDKGLLYVRNCVFESCARGIWGLDMASVYMFSNKSQIRNSSANLGIHVTDGSGCPNLSTKAVFTNCGTPAYTVDANSWST